MTTKFYIFILLLLTTAMGYAQVEFTAKAGKDKIGLNERLKLVFEMNENGDDFTPPKFENFRIYAGPAQSISQSWVNGKSSFSKTYTYYLEPLKKGNFTIGQAQVTIQGKVYKTTPIQIEVTGAVEKPKDGEGEEIKDITQGIHFVTEVSNANPYLNEAVSVVYKLYVSPDAAISGWSISDIPAYNNFWSHDIKMQGHPVKYGSYNGDKDYRYVEVKKTVLYPQKSGELQIDPMSLKITVDVPTQRRDIFGRTFYDQKERTLASPTRKINVRELPEQGRPVDFTGAVGDFQLSMEASKNELETEESVDIQLTLTGSGNMKLFPLPTLKVPNAFEAYDPERSERIQTQMNGTKGSITDTYTLVPHKGGEYVMGPIEFSYFDLKTKTYKTIHSNSIKLTVHGSASSVASSDGGEDGQANSTGTIQQRVTASDQFRYIKLKGNLHAIDRSSFFRSGVFWAGFLGPFVLLPMIVLVGKKRKKERENFEKAGLKKADKLARKYLSEAKKKIGDKRAYYDSLEQALHNFLKAKLNLPLTEMNKPRIAQELEKGQVTEDTVKEFISLLEACDFARYAPSSEAGMQQDYDRAAKVISEVDKQFKA